MRRGREQLCPWQERLNRAVSRVRARVEYPFATLKHPLGYRRVRYRGGGERNGLDFCLTLVACNIKRSLILSGAS